MAPTASRTPKGKSPISSGKRKFSLTPGSGKGRYSPAFIRGFVAFFRPFARIWFRPKVSGWEHIPSGPCILVGNHGGLGVMEIFVMLSEWTRHFGLERPVVGLSHDIGLGWALKWGVERIGGVRASPANALLALKSGKDVLVFPGGIEEVLRPFSERYRVNLQGRTGFLRIALEAQVPLVPLVTCGSHAQFTFLPGGPQTARAFKLGRHRVPTLPTPLGLVCFGLVIVAMTLLASTGLSDWSWPVFFTALAASLIPNPTQIEIAFQPVIHLKDILWTSGGKLEQAVCDLESQMQYTLTQMAKKRRTPWF